MCALICWGLPNIIQKQLQLQIIQTNNIQKEKFIELAWKFSIFKYFAAICIIKITFIIEDFNI